MSRYREIVAPQGWAPLDAAPGVAPMLQWLPVASLRVDDSYQRDLKRENWTRIRKIAAGFRWAYFSPVFVAPIEGGLFAVIDGQHRVHAALLCGIESVPCQVVQMTTAEQAAAFAAVNGAVTKITTWNVLRAELAAGVPEAVKCAEICAAAGCALMTTNGTAADKQPGEIYAVKMIKRMVAAGHEAPLLLALSGLRKSKFGQSPEAFSNEILRPFLEAVADRPWLVMGRVSLAAFCDDFDFYAALDRVDGVIKLKRREGFRDLSRFDLARAEFGEGLDRAFPQRMRAA